MVYFRWQVFTIRQNFIHLRQSAADLRLFVQKSKMAAAAIFYFIFVQYFGIHDIQRNTHVKFRANMCNSKRVMSDK